MGKLKIFVSFDYDNDRQYKYLLNAISENPYFEFSFHDRTPGEIQSNDVGRVKAVLTRKISEADCTLVIVGREANKPHRHRLLIGYRNWQAFEVAKSVELGKKIVAVKIKREYEALNELYRVGAKWVYSFTIDGIRAVLAP